jgi:hypothetical protein
LLADAEGDITLLAFTELLDSAIARKARTGTWKEWTWPATGDSFVSQESFRAFLFKHVYNTDSDANAARFLPKDLAVPEPESPVEAALRERMAEVWKEVAEESRRQGETVGEGWLRAVGPGTGGKQHTKRTRSTQDEIVAATKEFHIEMIIKMMAALSKEHELLYQLVAHPIVQFLVANVRDNVRETRFSVRSSCRFQIRCTLLLLSQDKMRWLYSSLYWFER